MKMLDPSTQKLYKTELNRTEIDKILDCGIIGKKQAERAHFVGFEGLDYWKTDNNICNTDQIRVENKRIGECEQNEDDIAKKRRCFDESTKLSNCFSEKELEFLSELKENEIKELQELQKEDVKTAAEQELPGRIYDQDNSSSSTKVQTMTICCFFFTFAFVF